MTERGFAPNIKICSKVVSCLYRLGRIDDANILLQKMVGTDPLLSHFGLDSLRADVSCVNIQNIANTIDENAKCFALPNNVVYNIAITGLCKSGKVDDARRVFLALLQRGFNPDNFTYTTLIHGYSASGDVNEAFRFRDEMLKVDLKPNIVTYNALINGLCKSGNLDRARRLFDKLPLKGLAPNAVTYYTLIDGYLKVGKTFEASSLTEKIIEEGISPSLATNSALVSGLREQEEKEKAMKLLAA